MVRTEMNRRATRRQYEPLGFLLTSSDLRSQVEDSALYVADFETRSTGLTVRGTRYNHCDLIQSCA